MATLRSIASRITGTGGSSRAPCSSIPGALLVTALLVDGFLLVGSYASAFFRDYCAAVVATRIGAGCSMVKALGGRPHGRLAAGTSL
ncbi:hypothetical protein MRX96_003078 [Rhipicephalus microplus]